MSEQNDCPMPEPTAEHRLLAEHAGRWKIACTLYMGPGVPPMQSEATEEVEMVGPFWTVSKFESSMMGMPFVGRALMGFESHTGKFVSTWVDSFSPVLFHFTGSRQGDTITLFADALSAMTGTVTRHRATEQHISKDERLFEMFCTLPDGSELKMMSNHYRRA